jgi:hypothetical protein
VRLYFVSCGNHDLPETPSHLGRDRPCPSLDDSQLGFSLFGMFMLDSRHEPKVTDSGTL